MKESLSSLKAFTHAGALQLQRGNLIKARVAFERAMSKACSLNDNDALLTCRLNLGIIYTSMKKPIKGIEYLLCALTLAVDRKLQGDIHYNLGIAYEASNDILNASKSYTAALQSFQNYGTDKEKQFISSLAMRAGILHTKLGKYKQAIICLSIAVKTYKHEDTLLQLSGALSMKAHCHVNLGQYDEAMKILTDIRKICQELSQDIVTVYLYNEMGLVASQCQDYKLACKLFESALDVHQQLDRDKPIEQAAMMQNLGALKNALGKYVEALLHSDIAANIYGSAGMRRNQCHCFLNMAYSYGQLGQLDNANECYSLARQTAKDLAIQTSYWQSLEGLGSAALSKGVTAKAISYFKRSLGILATIENDDAQQQDRLIAKLTYALQIEHISNNSHSREGLPNNNLQPASLGPSADVRVKASQDYAPRQLVEITSPSSQPVQIRKRKGRKQHGRRRGDKNVHPIHGVYRPVHAGIASYYYMSDDVNNHRQSRTPTDFQPVVQGIGTSESNMDHSKINGLQTQFLEPSRQGQRRWSVGDSSAGSHALAVLGLAVDDNNKLTEHEPKVGAGSHVMDVVDSSTGLLKKRVRSLKPCAKRRESTLMASQTSDSDRSGTDCVDGYDTNLDSENSQLEEEIIGFDVNDAIDTVSGHEDEHIAVRHMSSTPVPHRSIKNQSERRDLMGVSIRSDSRQSQNNKKDSSKLYSGRAGASEPIRRSVRRSNKKKYEEDVYHSGTASGTMNTTPLLDLGDDDQNDESHDREEMEQHMRQQLEAEIAITSSDEEKNDVPSAIHAGTTSSDDDVYQYTQSSIPRFTTYMDPVHAVSGETASGVNFFKNMEDTQGTGNSEPLYATIPSAHDSSPNSKAPPIPPPRNLTNPGAVESDTTEDSQHLEDMTRMERKQQAQQLGETTRLTENRKNNKKSGMCLIM